MFSWFQCMVLRYCITCPISCSSPYYGPLLPAGGTWWWYEFFWNREFNSNPYCTWMWRYPETKWRNHRSTVWRFSAGSYSCATSALSPGSECWLTSGGLKHFQTSSVSQLGFFFLRLKTPAFLSSRHAQNLHVSFFLSLLSLSHFCSLSDNLYIGLWQLFY